MQLISKTKKDDRSRLNMIHMGKRDKCSEIHIIRPIFLKKAI